MCPGELHSKVDELSCECSLLSYAVQDGHTYTAVPQHGAEVCEHNICPEQALRTEALTLKGKKARLHRAVGWAVGQYLC